MSRHSPPRSFRHRTPPRRRGRGRSLSPLSRSQPAPPGEERDRKVSQWDSQPRNKRIRTSRSRSREWMGHLEDHLDKNAPYVTINDHSRRDLPRDKPLKDKDYDRSRERNRDRERVDDKRPIKHRPFYHDLNQTDAFEENYLQPNFENNIKSHDVILDPSSITYNPFMGMKQDHILDKPRKDLSRDNQKRSTRDYHRNSPPKEAPASTKQSTGSNNRESNRQEVKESASDRINRLEKLVEKLVEGNIKSTGKSINLEPLKRDSSQDDVPELIPCNMKFTTSMWLNSIHDECLRRHYDEASIIRFVQDHMTGIVKAWFKSVNHYSFTWPELKMAITKSFPDNTDFAQTLRLLVTRDKATDETMTQYYFSKLYLCEACKISGENAVSCLIDGIVNPFIKQEIKSMNFLTPEALYSEYLSKVMENDDSIRIDHRDVREVVQQEDFISLESEPEEHYERKNPNSNSKKRCFTCKKLGHITMVCRHAPICYICKKKGHIAAKCRFNTSLFITSRMLANNVAKKNCYVNGKLYSGFIDTGFAGIALTEQVAEELQLEMRPTKEILEGFGGAEVRPLGEVQISLKVDSSVRQVKALIVENQKQNVSVIVGQAFLAQKGIRLVQSDGLVMVYSA